jgi:hypothetical protein
VGGLCLLLSPPRFLVLFVVLVVFLFLFVFLHFSQPGPGHQALMAKIR